MDKETLKAFLQLIAEECRENRELAAKILASNEARLTRAVEFIERMAREQEAH